MIALDTNVIVRFLTQDDPEQARRAALVFDGLSLREPGFVSTVVWAEIYWVLTKSYEFDRDAVCTTLEALSEADEIRCEDGAAVATALIDAGRGADFPDALIGAAAVHAGCDTVVTFDRLAAHRLGWRLV